MRRELAAALLGAAVFVCGCAQRTAFENAVAGAVHAAWEHAAPGMLAELRSASATVEIVPLGSPGEVGLVTAYATPRVRACRVRSGRFVHPLHRAPEAGTSATRLEIHEGELLAGEELCWLDDRLEAYLIQVNGSAVVAWVDETSQATGEESTIAWSASNGLPYKSLGRMAIDVGMASEESMSLDRLRTLHASHPEEIASLMLANPRYIMFRELSPTESLRGSRGRSLVAGVSLATDPRHATGKLLLIEPVDGSAPFLGLIHDGGAAIVGQQRIDRYLGSGAAAMSEAGAIAMPATVSVVEIGPFKEE